MIRRTLLIAIVVVSQIAIGCRYNRPILARGCWPHCHPAGAPMAGPPLAGDSGCGCSTCGTTAGYPVAGGVTGAAPLANYQGGYPAYSYPGTVVPPPQVIKTGDAPMPMPTVTGGMK